MEEEREISGVCSKHPEEQGNCENHIDYDENELVTPDDVFMIISLLTFCVMATFIMFVIGCVGYGLYISVAAIIELF